MKDGIVLISVCCDAPVLLVEGRLSGYCSKCNNSLDASTTSKDIKRLDSLNPNTKEINKGCLKCVQEAKGHYNNHMEHSKECNRVRHTSIKEGRRERFYALRAIRDIDNLKQDGDATWIPEIKSFLESELSKAVEEERARILETLENAKSFGFHRDHRSLSQIRQIINNSTS